MTEREILEQAKKRVKAKKGFYAHLTSYCITIGFFFFVNLMSDPGEWWFYWPAGAWGVGLAFHYFGVFGVLGSKNNNWEEKELQKEIARLKKERKSLGGGQDYNSENEPLELKELRKEKSKDSDWDERDFV